MSDFIVLFNDARLDAAGACAAFSDRPGLNRRAITTYEFAWGTVVVQATANPGCEPVLERGSLLCCAGRPYLVGEGPESPKGSDGLRMIFDRWNQHGARGLSDRLSGMFALLRCDPFGIDVLTDQMGFRPVYVGRDPQGKVVAVGTCSEAVAFAADRATDLDPVSLAELLVDLYITFPFTSRRGMYELAPASLHRVRPGGDAGAEITSETFWRPEENYFDESDDVLADRLIECMKHAGEDITRGLHRVALTLSGGWDSRAVLASIPPCVRPEAITFATRENRELAVARSVAEAAGIPQHIAWRDPEFFVDLLERGTSVVGVELRANAHGLCIVDSGLDSQFDVIIGGQLSDTFLKDHFMPAAERERLRPKKMWEPITRALRSAGILSNRRRRAGGAIRAQMVEAIRPEIWSLVQERQRDALSIMQRLRPGTAEEWIKFWPTSRQHDAGHNLANSRLYASDGLYMHRAIVEFAARMRPEHRYDGRLSAKAFVRLYGGLASINISNDGSLPGCPSKGAPPEPLTRSQHPWIDVHTSWADFAILQKLAPGWQRYRRCLYDSPAMDLIAPIVRQDPRRLIESYQQSLGVAFNWTLMQLVVQFDKWTRDAAKPGASVARRV